MIQTDPVGKWCPNDGRIIADATSSRRIDVNTASFLTSCARWELF